MKYVELLSRLKPATSPFVGSMLDNEKKKLTAKQIRESDAANISKCIVCRGRKRIKVKPQVVGQSCGWEVCPRCFGSGLFKEGNQRQTRASSKPESMPHDMIAGLTQGMPDHWFRAAVVFATHDQTALDILIDDIAEQLVYPRSDAWKLSEEVRPIRALGLSRYAGYSLLMPRKEPMPTRDALNLTCCKKSNWHKTWQKRAEVVSGKTFSWVKSANDYMLDMRLKELDEVV